MKILIVNYEYPPIGGGASNASFFISQALIKSGHEVTVITASFKNLKGYAFENNIHVYRIPAIRKSVHKSGILEMLSFSVSEMIFSHSIIKKQKPEKAIIFFTIPSGFIGPVLKRKYGIDYIISLRGGDVPGLVPQINNFHKIIRGMRQRILKHAKRIVANSKGLGELSEKADPFPVAIIPNGVDTNFFYPDSSLKINDGVFRFLFVGRFQEQKNIFIMLQQFEKIKMEMTSAFIINIVGDGPLKAELIQFVNDRNLNKQVIFHNWFNKTELLKMYRESDCFINYSLYEGMPNVVLEAMACGLPVLASNIMGHDVLVVNNKNGFLVELNNPDELSDKMKFAVNNKELMNQMGATAHTFVKENFSWEKTASDYINCFN